MGDVKSANPVRLSRGKRWIFTLFFLGFFFVLLELGFRVLCLFPGVDPPRKRCRFENTSQMNEYDYIHRGMKERQEVFSYDLYSPTLGWRVKPNFSQSVEKPGMTTYVVRTNSKGVRSEREIPYERIPGLFRILVLGASQTFGEGVSNGECFSDLLERRLKGTEWINLAVHGYANDQMLIYLKEEGRKYKPDLILLGFHPSVIYRNTVSFRGYAKPMFVLEEGKLKLTHVPVPSVEELLEKNRLNLIEPDCSGTGNLSYVYRFLRKELDDAYLNRQKYLDSNSFLRSVYPEVKKIVKKFMPDTPTVKKFRLQGREWLLTQAIFRETNRVAVEEGAKLLLVLYPGSSEAFEEEVARFAEQEGILFCDISPAFDTIMKEEGPGYFSLKDGHWNPRGHEIAADAIEACLKEKVPRRGKEEKREP